MKEIKYRTKEEVLNAIDINPFEIEFASPELKFDKEICMAAIIVNEGKNIGGLDIFDHIPEDLSDDREFVLDIASLDGRVILWASERLQDDREIVLTAGLNYPYGLQYASERLRRQDLDVIRAIMDYKESLMQSMCGHRNHGGTWTFDRDSIRSKDGRSYARCYRCGATVDISKHGQMKAITKSKITEWDTRMMICELGGIKAALNYDPAHSSKNGHWKVVDRIPAKTIEEVVAIQLKRTEDDRVDAPPIILGKPINIPGVKDAEIGRFLKFIDTIEGE